MASSGGAIGFRDSCVAGSKIRVFWWLALARNCFLGVVRSWERSHSVFIGSLWRENGFRESCVGGSDVRSNLLGERTASTLFELIKT